MSDLNPARSAGAFGPTDIPALPLGVQMRTLPNGLCIVVREDHSAPVVSAQAWSRAGSIHEAKWLGAGLSHVLEHMLFKGTATRPPGRIDQEVQEAGGHMNAYTSFDRTVYWINVPNTGARVAIDVLCDITQNATLPAEELVKEMDVIRREMDMGQDDPGRRSSRRLFETAYTQSPYRYTIIGYLDIFNELRREDVVEYYRERYAPNNLFFVVVGDLKAEEVFQQIGEAFANAKARPLPAWALPEEPLQMAPRELAEEAGVELGHVHLSWHTPGVRHPDVPLLDVLALVLGSGRSSRLYQSVRERQGLVNSVDAWTYSPGLAGLFGVSALVDADQFAAARRAILEEIEKLKDDGPAAAELSKAVKQFRAATLATRKTMQGQAQDLGHNWLSAGDLTFSERYLEAVERATPADLQRVARHYLRAENRTLYALMPRGTTQVLTSKLEFGGESGVEKIELPNGLRLLVKQDHRLPFVEFRAVFRGGVLAETPANNGLTQITGKMLLKGTTTRSAEKIAEEIESIGGSLESYGGNNSFGVNAEVLSSDVSIGLDLLSDVLLRPVFPPPHFLREQEIQLAGIKAQKDQLLQLAFRRMREVLFSRRGYGLDATGSEESVATLTPALVEPFYRGLARPDNCVLAVFGDVDRADVERRIQQAFGGWKAPSGSLSFDTASVFPAGSERVLEARDKTQAVVVLAFPATTIQDPARYALDLVQEACSDLGSRLFTRIRDELGLAYYVGAQHFAGLAQGYFAFYVGTHPDQATRVEEELRQEVRKLRESGLAADETQRAKAKIVGHRKIARQDLGHQALTAALDELYGLGFRYSDREDERYEAVLDTSIREAANRLLDLDRAVTVVMRPA